PAHHRAPRAALRPGSATRDLRTTRGRWPHRHHHRQGFRSLRGRHARRAPRCACGRRRPGPGGPTPGGPRLIAVLRIAASFFSIVALQRWMNWLAAALVLLALLNLKNDGVLVLLLPAAGLLAIVPAFCGGVALRYACTHSLLHLRPHGRFRLLLGATLVITLTAAIIAMPFQIQAWSVALGSMHRPALPSPAFIFQMAWAALVVLWLGMFLICRSQIAYAMFGV